MRGFEGGGALGRYHHPCSINNDYLCPCSDACPLYLSLAYGDEVCLTGLSNRIIFSTPSTELYLIGTGKPPVTLHEGVFLGLAKRFS